MGITKKIEVDGRLVPFRASAATPRMYRLRFGRDIYRDMSRLAKAMEEAGEGNELDMISLEMFEDIAYVMAKHADPSVPDSPDEWLEGFNAFSIYQVLPQLIDLWGLNVQTGVEAKKNQGPPSGR